MDAETEGNVGAKLEQIAARVDRQERDIECLENTLKAIAREFGDIVVSGPCSHCQRCLMIIENGRIYCPRCGNGQSL